MNHPINPAYPISGIMVFLGLMVLYLALTRKETWKVFATGNLDWLEYREERHSRRSGSMVHTTHYYTVRYNMLRFYGGVILYNIEGELDGKPGEIKLMQSNRGNWRIDRALPKMP